jgi:lauroyl/myristoyl acyltransferase
MTRVNSRSEVAGLDLLRQLLAERRQHVLAVLPDEQFVAEVPP